MATLATWAALCLMAPSASAQQSLFNVPAGVGTPEGTLFGQEQINVTPSGGESNTTLQVGLTPWLEAGLNVFHVTLFQARNADLSRAAAGPSVLGNVVATLRATRFLSVQAGFAGGVGAHPVTGDPEPVLSGWVVSRWSAPGRWGSYVVGGYAGSRGETGDGWRAGALVGFELPLVPERLHLMGDWVVGVNAVGDVVLGAVAFFGRNVQFSAGAMLPSPGSGNDYGGVIELTWAPEPHEAHPFVTPG
jgi:hypothetical protein